MSLLSAWPLNNTLKATSIDASMLTPPSSLSDRAARTHSGTCGRRCRIRCRSRSPGRGSAAWGRPARPPSTLVRSIEGGATPVWWAGRSPPPSRPPCRECNPGCPRRPRTCGEERWAWEKCETNKGWIPMRFYSEHLKAMSRKSIIDTKTNNILRSWQ